MGRIEKDKNLVKFWVDGKAKPYILDINKGELIGLRGAALVTMPPALVSLISCTSNKTSVLRLMWNGYKPRENVELYQLADKFDSIGLTIDSYTLGRFKSHIGSIDFKHMANWLKEHEYDYDEYLRVVLKERWIVKNNLQLDDHFTEPMRNWLYENFRNQSKEILHRLAYYLARGVWEFFEDEYYTMRSRFNDFIKYTAALEIPMEKGDFFRQYINTHRAYKVNEDMFVNKAIAAYQQQRLNALTFEDDNFVVVVPMTKEELRAEGESQRNCVGGYGDRIARMERNVVFIRKKSDPTHSYITCDIHSDSTINQFLIWGNRYTTDENALAFKRAYQHHLSTHWGE